MMAATSNPVPNPPNKPTRKLFGASKQARDAAAERQTVYNSLRDTGLKPTDTATKMQLSGSTAKRCEMTFCEMRSLPGRVRSLRPSEVTAHLSKLLSDPNVPVQYHAALSNALLAAQSAVDDRKARQVTKSSRPIDSLIAAWSGEIARLHNSSYRTLDNAVHDASSIALPSAPLNDPSAIDTAPRAADIIAPQPSTPAPTDTGEAPRS